MHQSAAATTKANTLPGVSFPIDDAAINELVRMAAKEVQYVQLVSFYLHLMDDLLSFDLIVFLFERTD